MKTACRKIEFCYGHKVTNHESKCLNLHGHNAVVLVYATPIKDLDSLGRVIDFSILKTKLGGWINENWDHTMILYHKDKKTINLLNKVEKNKDIFILNQNPTAENLAHFLLWDVCPKLFKGSGVIIYKIRFWETPNCFAEEMLDPKDKKVLKLY